MITALSAFLVALLILYENHRNPTRNPHPYTETPMKQDGMLHLAVVMVNHRFSDEQRRIVIQCFFLFGLHTAELAVTYILNRKKEVQNEVPIQMGKR